MNSSPHAHGKLLISALSALVACIAAAAAQATPAALETLRFESSPRGHVLVPVSIDGGEALIFALDTGAAKTLVTPGTVEKLRLAKAPGEEVSVHGVHGRTANPVVELQSLAVGGARVTGLQAVVLSLDHITRGNWHVDGVLGMDFLTRFDLGLDFGERVVSLWSAATERSDCSACPAGVDGIAFETIDPGFIVLPATVGAKPLHAVLDSGSGHSGINLKAAESLGLALPPIPAGAPSGHGFGIETGPVAVGETVLTGRAPLFVMDHPLMESLGLADRPAMLMGTDQLQGRSVTICYGLRTLFLH